jgi:hypothetical protein
MLSPSFFWCVALQWGVGSLVGLVIAVVVIGIVLGGVAWLVLSRWYRARQDQEPAEVGYGDAHIRGSQTLISALVVLFAFLMPMIAILAYVYFKSEDVEKTYAVYVDLRTAPETLGELADFYRAKTPVHFVISDAAKKVSIKGEYEGMCVADFFESICRQYDSQISCEPPSLTHPTLTIDIKK